MDVRLSPEQLALRQSVRRVVGDLAPRTVAELDDGARRAELAAAVRDTGWCDLRAADAAPGREGTPLASGVEVCVVAEELGRGLADVAFLGPTLAAELRRLTGTPATDTPETVLLNADLASFASGPEGATAIDAAGAARALALTGRSVLRTSRSARSTHHRTLVEVALGPAATRVDLTRPVAAPASEPHAVPGAGLLDEAALDRVVALGLAAAAADLVGTMAGAVALATSYAIDRHQYGRPVGSFQAVQHLLADAHATTEGSRSLVLHAAWAVDALPPREAVVAASTAKAYAARSARTVCETAIQVHGGIGNTWECLAHVQLRRALLSADLFGGVDACLETVLEDRLGGRAEVAGEQCHAGGGDGLR
jgi:alkylation response protein AidB-like acyl-CoA dehydrogenase